MGLSEKIKTTGTSLTSFPIQGIKIKKSDVEKFYALEKDGNNIEQAIKGINRFENNPNRVQAEQNSPLGQKAMERGLAQGSQFVGNLVEKSPETARALHNKKAHKPSSHNMTAA